MHIGSPAHGALRTAGQANQLHFLPFEHRDQREDFARLAAVRDSDHHIVGADHAEIAVAGFTRVDEERRRAGAGEGGGHFLADMAGFAHAHHHHFATAGKDHFAGAAEVGVNILVELFQPFAFNAQYRFTCLLEVEIRLLM